MNDNYRNNVAVSNSSLSALNPDQGGSLIKFRSFLEGEREKETTPSLTFGSYVHNWIENPDEFAIADFDKPSETICKMLEDMYRQGGDIMDPETVLHHAALFNYGQSWKEETRISKILEAGRKYFGWLKESNGKVVLSAADKELLVNVQNALMKNSDIYDVIMDDKLKREHEIYFDFPGVRSDNALVKIPCKALLDITDGESVIYDTKTTSKYLSKFFAYKAPIIGSNGLEYEIRSGAYTSYRYYRQLSFYNTALQLGYNLSTPAKCNIIVIETTPPYECGIYELPSKDMHFGHKEVREILSQIADNVDLLEDLLSLRVEV